MLGHIGLVVLVLFSDLGRPFVGRCDVSKRLNPHRRLLQRQQRLFREAMQAFGPSHDDSHKLQQGAVRSALSPRVQLTAYATPRDGLWEGSGKQGKVVRGKLAPPAKPALFSAPAEDHEIGRGERKIVDTRVQPNTALRHYARAWKNGRPIPVKNKAEEG